MAKYWFPLAGALLLAACGGGAGSGVVTAPQLAAATPIAVDPVAVTADFIALAKTASCADTTNRLYVIDNKQVYWERAGKCADNSYASSLYGSTPNTPLCSTSDSIAGPRTVCADERYRDLFTTITRNKDQADLGLGKDHKVVELTFLPPRAMATLAIEPVADTAYSGVLKEQQVVIRDQAAFDQLWAEHVQGQAKQDKPLVDFKRQMLIGVFVGRQHTGCKVIEVSRVAGDGSKINVDYRVTDLQTFAICTQAESAPMHMVAVERSDAPVSFTNISEKLVRYADLASNQLSSVSTAQTVVARDAQAFGALWAQLYGNGSAPPSPMLDFSKQMVVGVFLGSKGGGCYGVQVQAVYRASTGLTVLTHETGPAKGVACTMIMTAPATLVVVERSDDTVVAVNDGRPY